MNGADLIQAASVWMNAPLGSDILFNVTCSDYPFFSTRMPDSMDLCVWKGWLYVSLVMFSDVLLISLLV